MNGEVRTAASNWLRSTLVASAVSRPFISASAWMIDV